MALQLTSHEALLLTANFAFTADRMRAADETHQIRASICDTASRIAFLRAHLIAEREEIVTGFSGAFRRGVFATA
jgi:hypothetical protein